jgi:nucleotide-binding universal stress UspA family protein
VPPPFRSILCPTDLSPVGDAAVEVAFALAGSGAALHVLHVCEPAYVMSPFDVAPVAPLPTAQGTLDALENRARAHLERLLERTAHASDVKCEVHVVHDLDPAGVVARTALALKVEAVVLGTHGRTGLGRLLMGSVATDVLRAAKPQVIVVRPARS